MLGWKSRSFYPKPTGDPGRDGNARTVQFASFLLAFAVSTVAILNVISGEPSAETQILFFAVAGLVAAMVTNRAGSWEWAARTAFLAMLLTAMLLVFEARDGFRSFAMLVFPGMLLISVMLLDRASYMITAGMVLVAVAALGIAEKQGLTRAIPHVRSSTTYESIFFVDLNLLVFAMIGSRIASDAQSNVFDLRATIDRVSKANLNLEETAEALRESEQQLVSIYNTVRDVIFHLSVEPEGRFRFVSVNAAFLRVTGLSREAVICKTVNEVIPGPSLAMALGKYRQAIEENTTVVWEETSDYPTGRLTGEVSVAPVFDNKGTCTHLVGSVHDITERKRTQEEAMARQKLESLGVLANGIAHDFNNLLGSIMAEAELLEADLVAGLSQDGAIAGIKTVVIHGAEIVRELMIYAGQDQEGLFGPVDLSRLTAEMLELLKVSISKHARLKINLEKDLPAVLGSAPQIRQVLMNLIINASEAIGDKEGVIQVTMSRGTGGQGLVSSNASNVRAGDYVRLEVSDSGCGLTEETKAKIFDPFFTTKFAGRGLGLAVVQGIVRAHGGAVGVESAPGLGATFQVLLPCTSEAQNAVTSSGMERSQALTRTGATVLVVEDEEVLRRAISKALRIKGFSVMEAQDGSVAMDLVRTRGEEIDVILLDVTLPGASSREVFEEAKRIRANLKIVLTSAYDRKTVDVKFPGLQTTQFIRKPFQLDDLASTLRDALAN